jgi:hypothetical protein
MSRRGVTVGEIPRDGRGEPVWNAIPLVARPADNGAVAPAAGSQNRLARLH